MNAEINEDFSEWYVEYVVGSPENRETPPRMIKLKDLAAERQRHSDVESYTSIFRHKTPDPYVGPLLSSFPLDFDAKDDIRKAQNEVIAVIDELIRRYDIPEEAIGICFSGGKGFHLTISRHVFNVQPCGFLPQVWKSMAQELTQQCRLKTLDLDLYNCRRLWRLPNSKHPSGFYKIHLTRSELEKLTVEDIKDLATKPRTTVAIVPKHSLKAERWYQQHFEKVKQWMEERKQEFKPSDLVMLGTDLLCVSKLFQPGVPEGKRNTSRYTLIVYFRTAGKSLEECKQLLLDFNSRCTPPEKQEEILKQVEYLYQQEYHVGCGNFQEYCPGKDQCLLFMRRKITEFPEDIQKEALERLGSPDLEQWVLSVYDKSVVRETENKLLLHYLELSGRRKNPREKQIILLMGDPGGGKTQLANETTRLHRTKKRGRFSEHALDYSDLKNHDILYIQEILGVEKEEKGISTIRFLSAEDKGYTVEIAVRDPKTGKFTTEEYFIPPMCVVSTLTSVAVESQLERRSWLLNVDQSEEQTKLILEHKAKKEKERFLELMGRKEPDKDLQVLECTINMLEDGEVIVPFPGSLTKALDTAMLRSRGDYDKIMSLIKLRAWYHQRQRTRLTAPEGTKIWIASPEDGVVSLKLAAKAMRRWKTQLDERLIEALPHIKALVHEPAYISRDEGGTVYGVTASKLAKKMRISDQTSRNYLRILSDRGVLTYTEPKGRLRVYEFTIPEEEIEKKLEVTSVELKEITLASDFEKEAEEFLTGYQFKRKAEGEGKEIEGATAATTPTFVQIITEKPKSASKPMAETGGAPEDAWPFRHVKPGAPCELCGKHPVEYLVTRPDGAVLRRCEKCFNELRSGATKIRFVEEG